MRSSIILAGAVLLVALGPVACGPGAGNGGPRFALSFPAERSGDALSGRMLLFIAKTGDPEPRYQYPVFQAGPSTQLGFGIDVEGLQPGQEAVVDSGVFGFPVRSVADIPAGDYWVQGLLHRYETFHRADGHTVELPMDRGEGQNWITAPGNLYSTPRRVHIDPTSSDVIHISLDQENSPIEKPHDTKYVKYLTIHSDLLSKFWGRPMDLGAIVLLPEGFDENPNARYPLLVYHGHFAPTLTAGGGIRETPPDSGLTGRALQVEKERWETFKAWTGPDFPRVIVLQIQHPNPYFDDSYAVNSANMGPYGDAINKELIPEVEKRFRAIGQPWARVLTGGSTGGWEALGTQIFYPADYNGTWALCPDPVDFHAYRSVDLYQDSNAYFYNADWKRTPKPGYRNWLGMLSSTFEERQHIELVIGTHGRSGGQHDAWQAVFSPVGADGYPAPIFDKMTGVIDKKVAEYWRDHYDLDHILQRDWATLGPELRGKIHIYIGTMDNGYLNNAVYRMDAFLSSTTDPPYDGVVVYGDRFEHCWTGDPDHPNAVAGHTVLQRFLPAMAQRMISTAPRGADVTSWRY